MPPGFNVLDRRRGKRHTLADYLNGDVLEYYGWSDHLEQASFVPENDNQFVSEEALIERLIDDPTPLIIAGEGGIGKTRLSIELGKIAENMSWNTLFVAHHAKQDGLQRLVDQATEDNAHLILIVDYLEDVRRRNLDFDTIYDIASQATSNIRIIATCRSTFLSASNYTKPRYLNQTSCFILNLSDNPSSNYTNWLRGWVVQASQKISSDTPGSRKQIPAVSVIYEYAKSLPHGTQIPEGRGWVAQVLLRSIYVQDKSINIDIHDLANVLACFGLHQNAHSRLSKVNNHELIVRALAVDGWIKLDEQNEWVLGHDLLCDYVLQDSLFEHVDLFQSQVVRLIEFAVRFQSVDSVLTSIQRIIHDYADQLNNESALTQFLALRDTISDISRHKDGVKKFLGRSLVTPFVDPIENLKLLFFVPSCDSEKLNACMQILEDGDEIYRGLADSHVDELCMRFVASANGSRDLIFRYLDEYLDHENEFQELRSYLSLIFSNDVLKKIIQLRKKAIDLVEMGQVALAFDAYDEIFGYFSTEGTSDKELEFQCATAEYERTEAMVRGNVKTEEVLELQAELVYRYERREDIHFKRLCAKIRFSAAELLSRHEKWLKAGINELSKIVESYGQNKDVLLSAKCAMSLIKLASLFRKRLSDTDSEINCYDRLIQLYGASKQDDIRFQCAVALSRKGYALGRMENQRSIAIDALNKSIEIFSNIKHVDTEKPEEYAISLHTRAKVLSLSELGYLAALKDFDKVTDLYENTENASFVEIYIYSLLETGTIQSKLENDPLLEIVTYDAVLRYYADSKDKIVNRICSDIAVTSAKLQARLGKDYQSIRDTFK